MTTLYVIYDPIDSENADIVVAYLKAKVHHDGDIVKVPAAGCLNHKNLLFAGNEVLYPKVIFDKLCNITEINKLTFDEKTQEPLYPEHSIIVVEYDPDTKKSGRSVWVGSTSARGLEDLQTFVSTQIRDDSFSELLKKEAKLPTIDL